MKNNKSNEKSPYTSMSMKPVKAIFPHTPEVKFEGKSVFDRDIRTGVNRKCKK